jgi:hypothetical protein
VYQIAGKGTEPAVNALCEQSDWPAIEKNGAGRCTLIRGFITNEGEAEQLARGTTGDTKPRTVRPSQFAK